MDGSAFLIPNFYGGPGGSLACMTTAAIQRLGSCLCRKIRFTVSGEPYEYGLCHCVNCQKAAGSAFMTCAFFSPDKVSVIEGRELLREYQDSDTTSGNIITRSFCSECGTSLFLSSPTRTGWITLAPAAIDDPQDWAPHTENRPDARLPWVKELCIQPKDKLPSTI
ncbi:Mss4-like protein [Mycena crocata]|nr:Mss4-like protein [Mycena crocata]